MRQSKSRMFVFTLTNFLGYWVAESHKNGAIWRKPLKRHRKIYLLLEEEDAGVSKHDFSKIERGEEPKGAHSRRSTEIESAEYIFRRAATTNQAGPPRVNNNLNSSRTNTNNDVPHDHWLLPLTLMNVSFAPLGVCCASSLCSVKSAHGCERERVLYVKIM